MNEQALIWYVRVHVYFLCAFSSCLTLNIQIFSMKNKHKKSGNDFRINLRIMHAKTPYMSTKQARIRCWVNTTKNKEKHLIRAGDARALLRKTKTFFQLKKIIFKLDNKIDDWLHVCSIGKKNMRNDVEENRYFEKEKKGRNSCDRKSFCCLMLYFFSQERILTGFSFVLTIKRVFIFPAHECECFVFHL